MLERVSIGTPGPQLKWQCNRATLNSPNSSYYNSVIIYNNATNPAARAKAPGTWNNIPPTLLEAVAAADEAEEEPEPVADMLALEEVPDAADPEDEAA